MKRSKSVDDYIRNAEQWQPELERLRGIRLSAFAWSHHALPTRRIPRSLSSSGCHCSAFRI